jgi:O-antigen/teichoic acid export membrane protein
LTELANAPSGEAPPPRLGAWAVRSTVGLLGARVVSRLLALVTVLAAGNALGDTRFGQFQTAVTYVALAGVLLDLGFNNLYIREGSRHPQELGSYLGNVLGLRLVLAPLALAVLAAVLLVPRLEGLLLPGFAMMVAAALSNVLRSSFYARRRLLYEGVAIVLESVLLLGLTLYGAATGAPVSYYLWAYAGTYAFSCLYFASVISATRLVPFSLRLDLAFLRAWLARSLPFAMTSGLTMLYFKIDVPILQYLRNFQEVGWYTFAYKPFEALLFLPTTMMAVAFPVLSVYYARRDQQSLVRAINSLFKALLALGWPITVGTVILAPALTRMLHLYPQSQPALEILGVGIFLMFVTTAFTAALNSIDRQHLLAWAAVASLGVNVALNLVLVPAFGYLGAAWATNLTELVLVAVAWFMVRRVLAHVPVLRLSWRILLAGLAMGLVLIWFRNLQGPVTLALLFGGAAVYSIFIIVLRSFDATELALARSALRIGGGPA